ncbi:hypothetical protein [Nocardia sp. CC227C]|uniref:hypothetical protein n=1 Tax=Nocardia sp. CC227C TaxID=3044562 RepID=UPI003557B6F6
MVSIGHQTELFDVMSTMPPATSADIARAANLLPSDGVARVGVPPRPAQPATIWDRCGRSAIAPSTYGRNGFRATRSDWPCTARCGAASPIRAAIWSPRPRCCRTPRSGGVGHPGSDQPVAAQPARYRPRVAARPRRYPAHRA